MSWRKSCFMCWGIRKRLVHNLWRSKPPKWSTNPSKTSTSCIWIPSTLIHNLQICLTQSTGAIWYIIYLESSQETRRNPLINRLVLLTPKWSAIPGGKSTSCFDNILRCHRRNLQLLLHWAGRIPWQIFHLMYWDTRRCLAYNLRLSIPPKRFA